MPTSSEIAKKAWRTRKARKGKPRLDGSGKGIRANRGRGGCAKTQKRGRGRNSKKGK